MEESLLKRVLPNSPEAEQSVIGSMLMDRDAILAASELISADDFYTKQYGTLFQAMVDLCNEGSPVDLITLQNRLKTMDVPEEFCSVEFFRDLLSLVPTSTNVRTYAGIVKEKSVLRRLIKLTEGIADECYNGHSSLESILDRTEHDVFALLQEGNSEEIVPISDTVLSVIRKVEAAAKNNSNVTGIATGFIDLDQMTSGLQPSDLILIAARPSMGKTAFILNIAQHAAIRNHIPTVIFSLEMSKEQLVNRLLSMESGINGQNLRTGHLEDREWDQLVESSGIIASSDLYIDDTPGITFPELRSKCRKYKLDHDVQLIIVDYLQLMNGSGRYSDSRQQEISDLSRSLKSLARELNVPVVVLSQLNRAPESRTDHRPMLSDLRESGAIEQDADVVMFLYRDEYYNKDTDARGIAEVNIAKQRNGPTGTVELIWREDYSQFRNKE